MSSSKIRVDVADMTLGEMAEASELAGGDPDAAGFNFRQTAALACVVARRTDPSFTFEQALALKVGELEMVAAPDPEVLGGGTGVPPLTSVAPGTSAQAS